jgi:LysM repeat protein
MNDVREKRETKETPSFCPFLGCKADQQTAMAYPSRKNFCHRVKQITTPRLSHQRLSCLTSLHIDCPIFYTSTRHRLPKEYQYQTTGLSINNVQFIITAAIIGIFVTFITVGLLLRNTAHTGSNDNELSTEEQINQSITNNNQATPALVASPTQAWDGIPSAEIPTEHSPSPNPGAVAYTPTPDEPLLTLNSPIGGDIEFIIHRVVEGETLQLFADQYNTSVEAIINVNYDLISPLWIGWMVIIPINTTDVSHLPRFAAYMVEEDSILVEKLAQQLNVSPEEMCFYNGIKPGRILHEGEWVLVPKEAGLP